MYYYYYYYSYALLIHVPRTSIALLRLIGYQGLAKDLVRFQAKPHLATSREIKAILWS
jgi:hypothetical protein